jgi:hypothetical protein
MSTGLAQWGKQVLFALLSVADLTLTAWLLGHSDGAVYEANPIARWWLNEHGWLGLIGFKAAAVLLVVALAGLIARSRPRVAGRLLTLGCVALALVVLHNAALCRTACLSPEERLAAVHQQAGDHLVELNRQTRQQFVKLQAFRALQARLCQDLGAGRCTLREAAEELAAAEGGRNPHWLLGLAIRFPDLAPEERVAAWLIDNVAFGQQDAPQAARGLTRRLERAFQLTYARPLPRKYLPGRSAARPEQEQPGRASPGLPTPARTSSLDTRGGPRKPFAEVQTGQGARQG